MYQLGYFPHFHFLSLVMRGGGACPRAFILLLMYWQRQTPLGPACPNTFMALSHFLLFIGPWYIRPAHIGLELNFKVARWGQGATLWPIREWHMSHLQKMIGYKVGLSHQWWLLVDSSFETPNQNQKFPQIFGKFLYGISSMMVFVTFLVHLLCVRQARHY